MNARHLSPRVLLSAVLLLALTVGCNKNPFAQNGASTPPSDQQIALAVQSKILADPAVSNKQLTINANNGVVTLSGDVSSDAERAAAAAAAATVNGVKTVVNNLALANAVANAPSALPAPQAASAPAVTPRQTARTHRAAKPPATIARAHTNRPAPAPDSSKTLNDTTPAPATLAQAKPLDATPAPPAPPVKVTIPAGTVLAVRLTQPLASDTNQEGDIFRAALQTNLTLDDQVVIPQGAEVTGRVAGAHAAGRFEGKPDLALALYQISFNGRRYSIDTDQWQKVGSSRGASTAKKVGGGAAIGAILGGIFGGGKGAAIGAASGGGIGAGAQGLSHAEQVRLNPEAVLQFRLNNPLTVTPSHDANAGRQRLDTNPNN